MFFMRNSLISALAGVAMVALSAPAMAAQIGAGTVSVSQLFNPTVNLTTDPAVFTATMGDTFQVSGDGAFSAVAGLTGKMNGTLTFSSTVGTTLNQVAPDFFLFADGSGGQYKFSVSSVTTQSFVNTANNKGAQLYLLGTTLDSNLGFTATDTSLTLSFNSTGGSPFIGSATLSTPPAVPEPATWAMALVGFAATGAALRRKQRTSVTFA